MQRRLRLGEAATFLPVDVLQIVCMHAGQSGVFAVRAACAPVQITSPLPRVRARERGSRNLVQVAAWCGALCCEALALRTEERKTYGALGLALGACMVRSACSCTVRLRLLWPEDSRLCPNPMGLLLTALQQGPERRLLCVYTHTRTYFMGFCAACRDDT